MEDGETDEGDTRGKENTNAFEDDKKSVNIVDEAREIRDEIRKTKEELKAENNRREEIMAKEMLGGKSNAGGEPGKQETPEQKKTNQAQEFFKDTALGDAIKKTNE